MKEVWIPWIKTNKMNDINQFESFDYELIEDYLAPTVTVSSSREHSKQIKLIFEGFVGGYRLIIDKQTIAMRIKKSGYDPNYLNENCVYIVENSEYLLWLSEQCYHSWNSVAQIHCMIITSTVIMDVYSWQEPVIKKTA